ncbi:transferrin-like [Neodiprion pinetum]|uniref:transferrin-like n=1 Tax=Neodiprion fabricii TaxID=2872261 RepID=UPI001ED8C30A|nr:transferrin-like [Neodiprion fabricii]XP_046487884.1 transferrin-like [Neodiprion pinetum]
MRAVYLVFLFLGAVAAQEKYKLCATSAINPVTCVSLQRGESQVSCVIVEDSSECAIKLNRGEVDFGIFTAEEALLAYNFYPSDSQVIAQLKHPERVNETHEFKTVAVVPSNFTAGNLDDLKQGGFCHPGFSKTQLWNDNILKWFEKKLYNQTCDSSLTTAENEAANLKNYFGKACRPGNWVSESSHDAALKQKYPELCAACDNTTACQYANTDNHGHIGALNCLLGGKGKVAYVALSYVQQYFDINNPVSSTNANTNTSILNSYRFLCTNGSLDQLNSTDPCSWLKQPWQMILARNDIAAALQEKLKGWLSTDSAVQDWTAALKSILEKETVVQYLPELKSLTAYLSDGRELATATSGCGSNIRWCTVNTEENNKCNWIAKAVSTHGIQPDVSCKPANSTFECLRDIASDSADIITIDSNYGHFARQVFNLSTVMYTETENDRNSVVIAVVREGTTYNVSSFATLKSRSACFPEFGGIAWLSFVNAARLNNVISNSCDVVTQVTSLLSSACAPGFGDGNHQNSTTGTTSSKLCSLCPVEANNSSCSANHSNIYYGDKGALECLKSGAGDVAFIEYLNLRDDIAAGVINASQYRVLCRNGSLSLYTGFQVDEQCALSITIDSEVMGRKNASAINTTDTVLALLKIEDWLGYRVETLRPIDVYGPFNGTKNLLFKDSTTGLETTNSTLKTVLAYKELFAHYESCTGSGSITVLASFSTILLLFLAHCL